MANFVYGKAKQAILNGNFNFSSDNFKVAFVKDSYVPSQNVHEFITDIGNSNISHRSLDISNITNVLRNNRRRQCNFIVTKKYIF